MWIKLKKLGQEFRADESGATAIEYALIAALLGVGLIVGYRQVAMNNDSLWGRVENEITNAVTP